MGVVYKLKDDVVQFILSQRQENTLLSCRQLAEAASLKFGLQLSKSSVHDVLKESGIVTPRGRKPSSRFSIPQEKKKEIQSSLSKVNLLPAPSVAKIAQMTTQAAPAILTQTPNIQSRQESVGLGEIEQEVKVTTEYEEAGKIFLKAALWDLGVFSAPQDRDWEYLLTYAKGIKVDLENGKDLFIDLPAPIERCIRETVDALINNIRPMLVHKVSDQELLKSCLENFSGYKMCKVSIVDENNKIIIEFNEIVEHKSRFIITKRLFVECNEINELERAKAIFFPKYIESGEFIDKILKLKGFDSGNTQEIIVTLLIEANYENKGALQEAIQRINEMCLQDEQGRQLKVKFKEIPA